MRETDAAELGDARGEQPEHHEVTETVERGFGLRVVLLIIAAVLFLVLVAQKTDLNPARIQAWVEAFGWWGPALFIVIYTFAPLILFPATALTAIAGVMWSWPWALLYVSLGCNVGANLGFWAGRVLGKDGLERMAGPKVQAVRAKLMGQGFLSMVFVRVVPVAPFHVVNIGAGVAGIRWRDFFWATLLATMPGRFLALYAIDNAGRDSEKAWWSAAGLVLVMVLPMVYARVHQVRMKRKEAALEV